MAADPEPLEASSVTGMPPRPLMPPQDAYNELGRLVVGAQSRGRVLARVGELAKACVAGAEEVSVTLVDDGAHLSTAAFTGRLAAHLDEQQYADGFGPCLHAAETGQVVRIDDTAHETTYPDFAAVAARQGVRSVLSVGLPIPQRIVGALNVYRFEAAPLGPDSLRVLQAFSGFAAVALANHALYASAVALSTELHTAMQSRAVIDQAKGVLMGRLHCSADEAFQHLVTQSQHRNRKLREIAAEVVAHA